MGELAKRPEGILLSEDLKLALEKLGAWRAEDQSAWDWLQQYDKQNAMYWEGRPPVSEDELRQNRRELDEKYGIDK
jgi:hypothetical protein